MMCLHRARARMCFVCVPGVPRDEAAEIVRSCVVRHAVAISLSVCRRRVRWRRACREGRGEGGMVVQ